MGKKPVLSIGIIFKNEARCLERCLKALDGLRKRVPCELVMADTGSDDGSREVAERYADILFDFPWVNDFSAARNAVMDRCTGTWFLSVDADEWLDKDFSELEYFLKHQECAGVRIACAVVVRNYMNADLKGDYGDFMAGRMLRLSSGVRYEGAIHEHWNRDVGDMLGLGKTVFHHDGYVGLSGEAGAAKRKRNMTLLRKKLEESPKDPLVLMQCIESSVGEDLENYIRRAVGAVEEKQANWELFGPSIYRYAVSFAKASKRSEMHDWAERARELFPKSLYVRIDINYFEFSNAVSEKKYEEAIPLGEEYLRAISDYHAQRYCPTDLAIGSVSMLAPEREDEVRIHLANAYFSVGRPQDCWRLLRNIPIKRLNEENTKNYFGMLLNVYAQSEIDTSGAVVELWDEAAADEGKKRGILSVAAGVFPQSYRDAETELGFRHAYRALLLLGRKCGPGISAQVLEAPTVSEMREALLAAEEWDQISIHALGYALERGLSFPMPEKPLRMEESDRLAKRLTGAGDAICRLVMALEPARWCGDRAYLDWARSLVLVTVRTYPWGKVPLGADHALSMAKTFARVEAEFLRFCYTPEMLTEENVFMLPPLHRFGWYCAQAFDALEAGKPADYVDLLRKGLASCEDMAKMAEFLVEHTPELQPSPLSPELQAMVERVRMILAMYPADDPAVAALKASSAYQKVAYLIEGGGA